MAKPTRRKTTGGVTSDSSNVGNDRGGVLTETAQHARDTTTADIDRERVAQRAYELYLARGGADGRAMEDWLAAERELSELEAHMGEP